jgi:hypothetical protein
MTISNCFGPPLGPEIRTTQRQRAIEDEGLVEASVLRERGAKTIRILGGGREIDLEIRQFAERTTELPVRPKAQFSDKTWTAKGRELRRSIDLLSTLAVCLNGGIRRVGKIREKKREAVIRISFRGCKTIRSNDRFSTQGSRAEQC